MSRLALGTVHDEVLAPLRRPSRGAWILAGALALVVGGAAVLWVVQARTGMGLAGLGVPVSWGVYIASFVFWVGIAHSGTLISAVLHLLRISWRTAVARAAEAMTVVAVGTASLFPLIHLGRVNVVHYMIPHPNQRDLWPNFTSPLVWDVFAVGTYFVVSTIFFYVGILPDLAAVRDRGGPGARVFRWLSLGWSGAARQWRHHGRAYLFFAALATPLVVSVHSVVSWDFAMGNLPGWHTTIFAPYFVAGAIHSGLAMVLTLLIPLRRTLGLERWIHERHFDLIARTLVVTGLIVAYAYVVEAFIAWYSEDVYERQFALWRATSWPMGLFYALLFPLNVGTALAMAFRRVRANLRILFVLSLLVNVGMYLERFVIVVGSTSHDFLPHNWGGYAPSPVEIGICVGAAAFFALLYLAFVRTLPFVALSEVKEDLAREEEAETGREQGVETEAEADARAEGRRRGAPRPPSLRRARRPARGLVAVFCEGGHLVGALDRLGRTEDPPAVEAHSPMRLEDVDRRIDPRPSPVRLWTLAGAVAGLAVGFALPIGTARVHEIVVGGKPPVALVPFLVIAFEMTVLFGALGNLGGLLVHARLGRPDPPRGYDPRFGRDRFGLVVETRDDAEEARLRGLLEATGAEEIHAL